MPPHQWHCRGNAPVWVRVGVGRYNGRPGAVAPSRRVGGGLASASTRGFRRRVDRHPKAKQGSKGGMCTVGSA
jgi:hypothetical protein|eukprot:COSAG06_NODE_10481_length_1674_cov_1.898413_3_plen_73_part_00